MVASDKIKLIPGSLSRLASRIAFIAILPFAMPALAAQTMIESTHGDFLLRLSTDATSRSTAESFLLTATVDAPIEARRLSIEQAAARMDGVRMVELNSPPPRAIATDRLRHEVQFRIYPYLSGKIVIDNLQARFQREGQLLDLPFGELVLEVTSLLGENPEIAELADWVDFPEEESGNGTNSLWLWLLLIIVIIIVIVIKKNANPL